MVGRGGEGRGGEATYLYRHLSRPRKVGQTPTKSSLSAPSNLLFTTATIWRREEGGGGEGREEGGGGGGGGGGHLLVMLCHWPYGILMDSLP